MALSTFSTFTDEIKHHWNEDDLQPKGTTMAIKLFEYAVLLKGGKDEKDTLLVAPTPVIAKDEAEARIHAARAIPEENAGDVEQITLLVRPF